MGELNPDIRWKQRFQNYEKAYRLLEQSLEITKPSEIERGGMIQFFEITFELSWKLMQDYLIALGFQVKSPRDTIKQAFQAEIIADGHGWIKALDSRNQTVRVYDEATARQVELEIRQNYFPLLRDLFADFQKKSQE